MTLPGAEREPAEHPWPCTVPAARPRPATRKATAWDREPPSWCYSSFFSGTDNLHSAACICTANRGQRYLFHRWPH